MGNIWAQKSIPYRNTPPMKERPRFFCPRHRMVSTSQEKAALMKELNDKSTVLAGVKDKTKAYVDKLKNDNTTALTALQVLSLIHI